jgi:hypothetical protein
VPILALTMLFTRLDLWISFAPIAPSTAIVHLVETKWLLHGEQIYFKK